MSNGKTNEFAKVCGGAVLSYLYNQCLNNFPSRTVRQAYLRAYLARLGKNSGVQMGVKFLNGRKVSIGENAVVNWGCVFDGRKFPIQIGKNVSLGPEATVLTLGHDPRSKNFANKGGPVIIEDYCWVAYRAIILPGITLAEGTVVGAGSVLTRDTEPYGIYAGIPAVKCGERPRDLEYELHFNPWLI
ncbi:MAG: acyltransferase [Verrucomicrobiae bacterium]|nr:acyltransferase [Verrucomicrobiae bacterium]